MPGREVQRMFNDVLKATGKRQRLAARVAGK
jgi:hypothetical protein